MQQNISKLYLPSTAPMKVSRNSCTHENHVIPTAAVSKAVHRWQQGSGNSAICDWDGAIANSSMVLGGIFSSPIHTGILGRTLLSSKLSVPSPYNFMSRNLMK